MVEWSDHVEEPEEEEKLRSLREQPELVLVVEVIHVIELARVEGFALLALPFGHRDVRQGPEVGLTGALEVESVVELGDRFLGRVAVLDLERAEWGLQDNVGWQFLSDQARASEGEGGGDEDSGWMILHEDDLT